MEQSKAIQTENVYLDMHLGFLKLMSSVSNLKLVSNIELFQVPNEVYIGASLEDSIVNSLKVAKIQLSLRGNLVNALSGV